MQNAIDQQAPPIAFPSLQLMPCHNALYKPPTLTLYFSLEE